MNNRASSLFIFLSYVVGVIIGLFLIFIAAWADMESAFYGFSRLADTGLAGFNCPVMMNRDEAGTVSLTVSNPTDSLVRPSIKAEISTSFLIEESLDNIELAPGESKEMTWSVGPENIDLERFIFAKVLMYSAFPLPNREASCGIFILDLPVSGKVSLPALVALSLLGMGFGLYGMNKAGASDNGIEKHVRPLAFLAAIVILGIFVSFRGGWVPSILLLAVALLMAVTLLGLSFMGERRKR